MKLTMLGAAKFVTGSMMLLETESLKIVIDCGLVQTNDTIKDITENGDIYNINPSEIDYLILTHAHIDHAGKIPLLYKKGFNGPILTTEPTMNLCKIALNDCAFIWKREIEKLNKNKKYSKRSTYRNKINKNNIKPLYTSDDVEDVMMNFRGYGYNKEIILNNEVSIIFHPVGHIMGAASIEVIVNQMNNNYMKQKRIVFSGDISGLHDKHPFIKSVEYINKADYLILESTYGDRKHKKMNVEKKLTEIIKSTCIDRKKTVLIASFSIQRLQELIYYLYDIYKYNDFDDIPIYIDTPMGTKVTLEVYAKMLDFYNDKDKKLIEDEGDLFLNWNQLKYTVSQKQSKNLLNDSPKIIIASAGMMQAGRIIHHIDYYIPSKGCAVVLTGYCAIGTFGRKLLDTLKYSKSSIQGIEGKILDIHAKIFQLDGMSGHADYDDLLKYALNIKNLKKIILNHGDINSINFLKTKLQEKINIPILIPNKGQKITLK